MNNTSINELNEFLKGEYMAIEAYERYIRDAKDDNTKMQLQKIQQDHKQHVIKISERIQNLGGKPANGVGLTGTMVNIFSGMKSMGENDDTHAIVRDAYEGEYKGINMASEVVKGDLDTESNNMINDILNQDRIHLETLRGLMQ